MNKFKRFTACLLAATVTLCACAVVTTVTDTPEDGSGIEQVMPMSEHDLPAGEGY